MTNQADLFEAIRKAININSAENGSNTPDAILAKLCIDVITAFDRATQSRDAWYGLTLGIPKVEMNRGHAHYTYKYANGYQHFLWYATEDDAHQAAGDEEHEIIISDCDDNCMTWNDIRAKHSTELPPVPGASK